MRNWNRYWLQLIVGICILTLGIVPCAAVNQCTLSGHVYKGTLGDTSTGISGAPLSLFSSDTLTQSPNGGIPANLISTTTADASGYYQFTFPCDRATEFPPAYIHIRSDFPAGSGWYYVGSQSIGGTVGGLGIYYPWSSLFTAVLTGNIVWWNQPTPPVAAFGYGISGSSVSFADQSTNTPTSWSWNFGDGGTSTLQNPIHQYTSSGTYTVSLTAANAYGSNTNTRSFYVTVPPPGQAPVANFVGTPTSGATPLTVHLTDQSTNNPTSWSWTFGDGGTSTLQNPIHEYVWSGFYTVSLTAANTYGSDVETKREYITPTQEIPVANFVGTPTSGATPLTVHLTDQSTNNPTIWSWTFGDGGTSTLQNPTHQYTSSGTYSVSLTAANLYGSDGETKTNYITVGLIGPVGQALVANFVATPTSGTASSSAPLTVHFTDTSTGDPTSWNWFFDYQNNPTMIACESKNCDQAYYAPGTYSVKLWIKNRLNQEDTEIKYNYITVIAPVKSATKPSVDFTYHMNDENNPLQVCFDASRSTDPNGIAWYYWNFGDGSPETPFNSSFCCHTYTADGTYQVTLRVVDREIPSQTTSITKSVTIATTLTPCFETYIGSGSLKYKNDESLMCSVQITSLDRRGSIMLEEGTHILDFNNHPVQVLNITRIESIDLPPILSDQGYRYAGYAYHCLPDGATFNNPVMISILLSEDEWSNITRDDLIIRGFNSRESRWENQPTTTHPDSRRITANLNHFSIFALFSRQSTANTTSSNTTTGPQSVSVKWKGTPVSPVIPLKYAPLAAVAFGMVSIFWGAFAPNSGIFQRIQKFIDIIQNFLKDEMAGLISRIEIEKRKISPLTDSEFSILTLRELVVIVGSAIIFALAFIFKYKIAVQWSTLLIFLIMGGLATIVHELGHRLFGRHYGYPSELQFWSLGAVTMLITAWIFGTVFAQPSRTVMQGMEKESDIYDVIVTLAGPLINLLFAGISFLLLPLGGYLAIMGAAGFSMNLLASVCSLIPVKPMDGERVFHWNKFFWALIWLPIFVIYCIFFIF